MKQPATRSLLTALGVTAALALSGCGAQYWPQASADPSLAPVEPTSSIEAAQEQEDAVLPAWNETQLREIMTRISAETTAADAALDPEKLTKRWAGTALESRTASYRLRAADGTKPMPMSFEHLETDLYLPQQTDSWPRTGLVVVHDSQAENAAPAVLTLSQADAHAAVQVVSLARVSSEGALPKVAAADIGTPAVAADAGDLVIAPKDLAAAYAANVKDGEASATWGSFDTASDKLLADLRTKRQQAAEANQARGGTTSLDQQISANPQPAVALATTDGGAIVSLAIDETEVITPTRAGIDVTNGALGKLLSGVEKNTKGFKTKYTTQLLMYVPSRDTQGKVQVLGYSNQIVSSSEA